MVSHHTGYIYRSTNAMDAYDTLQIVAKWFNEFAPVIKGSDKRNADVLLRLFHSLALCCAIAGIFALYVAGKLVSHPDSITMYVTYHHQNLS